MVTEGYESVQPGRVLEWPPTLKPERMDTCFAVPCWIPVKNLSHMLDSCCLVTEHNERLSAQ